MTPAQIEAQRIRFEEQQAEAKQQREQRAKEREQKKREAEEHRQYVKDTKRSFLSLSFARVEDDGEVILILKNVSGKDIKGLRGGYRMENSDGAYMWSSGLTIDPNIGQLFIANNESKEVRPYGLKNKADKVEIFKSTPKSVNFYFESNAITYMDDSVEEKLVDLK